MIDLVPATALHIPFLAKHMRPDDIAECVAMGRDPAGALFHGLSSSLWALTALVDDEPHAMMGVVSRSMIEGIGVPWMLGTERVYDHARELVRFGPTIIDEMHATFGYLENIVSVDNARAQRFLTHVGFEICDVPINVGGISFVHFRKGA